MITHDDWREIQKFVTGLLAETGDFFSQGVVVKRDTENKLVWLKEFGDQPIPLIAFNFNVKYFTLDGSGHTVSKSTRDGDVELMVPEIGETVLVARMMGSRRLPKCLGIIQSKNYVGTD